ncbi:MAG: hypothetical protein NW223_14740 [Hyphomicrobiaceae bacterium]|nr:hypothetical protein [Hyphomicrobiaceae bacterium]
MQLNRSRKLAAAIAAGFVCLASTVHAATLVAISGQVLVNRGDGFQIAQPGIDLKPGDVVIANPGAAAQIMYPEGCLVPVVPLQIATVLAKPNCPPLTTGAVPAAAAAVAAAGSGAGVSTAAVVGGSAALAGGGATAYALSKSKASTAPASP